MLKVIFFFSYCNFLNSKQILITLDVLKSLGIPLSDSVMTKLVAGRLQFTLSRQVRWSPRKYLQRNFGKNIFGIKNFCSIAQTIFPQSTSVYLVPQKKLDQKYHSSLEINSLKGNADDQKLNKTRLKNQTYQGFPLIIQYFVKISNFSIFSGNPQ